MKKLLLLLFFSLISSLFVINNTMVADDTILVRKYDFYKSFFGVLPDSVVDTKDEIIKTKIALGRKLYNDTILSLDKDLSCNSCHNLKNFGVDNEITSLGHKGQRGERNSPTTFNSVLNFVQFWDGRAASLEEQAVGPVLNPVEMAMPNEKEVIKRLSNITEYQQLFTKAFPEDVKNKKDPISFINVGNAIAVFEKTLLTPAAIDKYLSGDENALNAEQKLGLAKFVDFGCVACHSGASFGGNMYQKIGLIVPYPTKDLGRYNITKQESDKYVFKVPSLRNISKTAPYFHDGSIRQLDQAIKLMGKHQLGKELNDKDIKEIISFLNSLTGNASF